MSHAVTGRAWSELHQNWIQSDPQAQSSSPPPCGEGLGVGVAQTQEVACRTPLPSPPAQGGREESGAYFEFTPDRHVDRDPVVVRGLLGPAGNQPRKQRRTVSVNPQCGRRDRAPFLGAVSARIAWVVAFAAMTICAGSIASAQPYIETPMLAGQVAAKTLPAVEHRLPQSPRRIDLAAMGREFGRHGGSMRTLVGAPGRRRSSR